MEFENRAQVASRREDLWEVLMDIPTVSACIPGVEEVRQLEPDHYSGIMSLRVGPIRLRFAGRIRVTDRNREQWKATMKAEGSDPGTSGKINSTITMQLHQLASEETEIQVTTQASVLGKLGEFGQPVMRKKADTIMNEFVKNLARVLEAKNDE